jgi:hypothetical protein
MAGAALTKVLFDEELGIGDADRADVLAASGLLETCRGQRD